MADSSSEQKIRIDDVDYQLRDMSESAKAQIASIQFVDSQLQQLSNELAVADTARMGYTAALKGELAKISKEKK